MSADNKFQFLLEKIRRNKGVDFSLYREGTLRRRIDSRLRTTGCADYLEYVSYLNRNPEEYDRLIEAVTINVTEFFRNPETFHAIQQKVLPEIIKDKQVIPQSSVAQTFSVIPDLIGNLEKSMLDSRLRGNDSIEICNNTQMAGGPHKQEHSRKTIRVWCAGTSYGEETYSIAILLLQVLQERITDFDVKISGTDIDPDCIAKAKNGLYEPSHLKEVNKNILNKYFDREGENYRVKDELKQLTEFKLHNLTSDKQLKNIDLILCRNVVIYFTKPLQAYVYNLFANCLKPGGFLVLGKVESLGGYAQGFFEAMDNKERIYRNI